jgi:glycerate-2-kinase
MIEDAKRIYTSAVQSIMPERLIHSAVSFDGTVLRIDTACFPLAPGGKIHVVGVGKASAEMAKVVEDILKENIFSGTVITKYGHAASLKKIKVFEAGHPVPDKNGLEATRHLLNGTQNLSSNDIVIFLLSGGASSLLVDVPTGAELEDVIKVYDQLLKSGATIHQFNTVRKHLSSLKGGGLLRHFFPATVISLVISDVPGDDLSVIGSGPTFPDKSTPQQAKEILLAFGLWHGLHTALKQTLEKKIKQTTKNSGKYLEQKTYNLMLANNKMALEAAAQKARTLGYVVYVHPEVLEGNSNEVATGILEMVIGSKKERKSCFLFGSETTVKVTGSGKGGRCQQMVLAAFAHLQKCSDDLVFFAAGTDGQDGPTEVAGAVIDRSSFDRARSISLDAGEYLRNNDSYHFFQKSGGHVFTGPTCTNVMDIVIVLAE